MSRGVRFSGIAAYAPERSVPNSYFDQLLRENVSDWLEQNVEIFERRWCAADESTADLCEKAALSVLERAGLEAADLDLIIVSTDTPEFLSPSTASVLQDRIQAKNAGSFDINTACAGFVTAMDVASKYILSDDRYRHILVIGAYAMSKYLNLEDKKTVTLFADGAGAMILSSASENYYTAGQLLTEGQYNEWMGIYGGGTREPMSHDLIDKHRHQLQFVKKFPKELNPQMWSQMIKVLAERKNIAVDDFDHFFLTQININSIRETMDLLGQAHDKAHTVMHHYGYTGSACIPMALNDAWEKGIVKKGDRVVFVGSGGGLAFASAALEL
jgi:3-oxoacyl-[acyl-carrier-protein] synthase-3